MRCVYQANDATATTIIMQLNRGQHEQGQEKAQDREASGFHDNPSVSQTRQDLAALTNLITQGLRNPAEFYSSIGPTLNELTFGLLGSSFNPEKDINHLTGKVVFVTGGTFGSSCPCDNCDLTARDVPNADHITLQQPTPV